MLNCLLIKKMESWKDLYFIMVIFHCWDDFEKYVFLPVFHQMMLGLNLDVLKALSAAPLHVFPSPPIFPRENLITIFISAPFLSLSREVLPGCSLAPSSFILVDNMLELPSVLLQTSGTFFHFVSSLLSCDLGELKSQCSIME